MLGIPTLSPEILARVSGGGLSAFGIKAQKLLASRAAASPIPNATGNDVPTTVQSSSFGNSSLTGAAFGGTSYSMSMLDPTLTSLGNPLVVNGSLPFCVTADRISDNGLKGGGAGAGIRFKLHGSVAFDVGVYDNSQSIRVKVNGAWTDPVTMTVAGWLKYTFPTVTDRIIEIHWTVGTVFAGLNVGAGGAIQAAPLADPVLPKVGVFGDSYSVADYATALSSSKRPVIGFAPCLAEVMGVLDMSMLGVDSQGSVFTDLTYGKTFLDRVNSDDLARFSNLDLLVFYNSINDYQQTAATITANWRSILQVTKTALPNTLIWGFTGFKTTSNTVDTAHNAAFINAFAAELDGKRVGYWDGNDQIITIGGNEATYIGADGLHLNDAGGPFAAGVVGSQLATWLATVH